MFESATRFIALELRRREAAREGDGESALGRYESERVHSSAMIYYLIRWIIGVSLAYIGIGFWILAASAYKRAGTFRWNKNLRVISAILILGSPFSSLLSEAKSSSFSISPLLQIFLLLAAFVHCVLLFKDGNKSLIN